MQWSTRGPFYSPCLHSVTLPNWLLFLLLGMTRSNRSEEGLLSAYSLRDYSPLWWRWGGLGPSASAFRKHSTNQQRGQPEAFLQWLTSSRDAPFLRRPHTFKIAALIEDQVFKHKACRRTFHIKPQQWLRALAWFLNNPWIFAFSRLTQLVQILITYWRVTVCSRPLFVSVCAPYLVSCRAAREESPRASQGSVVSRFKPVVAQATSCPHLRTPCPSWYQALLVQLLWPKPGARILFSFTCEHPDNFIFQIHTPLWLTVVNIVAFWNLCLPSTWDFASLTSFLLNFPVPNPG